MFFKIDKYTACKHVFIEGMSNLFDYTKKCMICRVLFTKSELELIDNSDELRKLSL